MSGPFNTPPTGGRQQQQFLQFQQQQQQQTKVPTQQNMKPQIIARSFSQSNVYPLDLMECTEHPGEWVTNFCSCPECLRPLCPECVTYHNTWHKQQQTYAEIETMKGLKSRCEAKILNATQVLEQQILQGQQSLLLPQDNLEESFKVLRLQRARIQEVIDAHFKTLQDQLEQNSKEIRARIQNFQPTFDKMRATIDELSELQGFLGSRENSMEAILKICQLDASEIVARFKSELNRTATASKVERMYPRFDEYRILFLAEELEKVISLRKDDQSQLSSTNSILPSISGQKLRLSREQLSSGSDSIIEVTQNDWFERRAPRKYLHFFQNDDNKLHYIDLSSLENDAQQSSSFPDSSSSSFPLSPQKTTKQNIQFTAIDLQISFRIPSFHKSISIPSGELFLTGGTIPDGSMQKSGQIYQYDWNSRNLQPLGNMIFARSSHGIAYLNNKIYVVGGYEDKHIMTNRCERFNLSTMKWERVGSMNHPAASISLCSFNGRYLYKFGGIGEGLDADGGVLSSYIEKYDMQEDVWEIIDPTIKNNNAINSYTTRDFSLLSTSAAIQITGNQIFVFGGYHEDNSGSDQSFILQINEEESNNKKAVTNFDEEENEKQRIPTKDMRQNGNQMNSKSRNNLATQYTLTHINSKRLPFSEAFWSNVPVISNKKIYALQNIAGENTDNCLENERRILMFDQFKWNSLS